MRHRLATPQLDLSRITGADALAILPGLFHAGIPDGCASRLPVRFAGAFNYRDCGLMDRCAGIFAFDSALSSIADAQNEDLDTPAIPAGGAVEAMRPSLS